MSYFSRPQSAAVRIVKPSSNPDEPAKGSQSATSSATNTPRKDTTQRQCRNIVIYGRCKYQDKGCIYYHPPSTPPEAPATPSPPATSGARPESPVVSGVLSAHAVNAPVFVPKAASTIAASVGGSASSPPTPSRPPTASAYSDDPFVQQDNQWQDYEEEQSGYDYSYDGNGQMESLAGQMEELSTGYYDDSYDGHHYGSGYDDAAAYFATAPAPMFIRQPLNYHLYTPTTTPDFVPSTTNTHFVPPSAELRQMMQERSETIRGVAPPGLNLPDELQGYHTLVPLEVTPTGTERRKFGNWYSTVYRAIKASDGLPYVLRRIENYRLVSAAAFGPIEFWSNLKHPTVVNVKEAFTTRAFDDNSLVVVYAYHPNSRTLADLHLKQNKPPPVTTPVPTPTFTPRGGRFQPGPFGGQIPQSGLVLGQQQPPVPERTMWSYIVQIAGAIKRVHEAGYAVRNIDATKILLTSQNRIRLSSCGTMDVLMHDTPQDVHLLQQEDLSQFGRLIFTLCCQNTGASVGPHFQKSIDHILRFYGQDMKSLALWLISKGSVKNIDSILDSIRGRVLQEQEDALSGMDRYEHELQSELENARLVRLMTKFGFINERPEFAREPRWSETGDRYIIKLFRDYVFHQVDEHGNPVLDMSHVLECLNKLDAGTDEKMMLVARDEQSCLVVSYKDVKACMEGAFSDLTKAAIASPAAYKHR
ncbi:hypothetical protein DFP72DRAFT_912891 [Ephemerocybe angulata]|uniref:PAN2-PAN3 deadenylation complex subunit PAN3 n=1 Tax=Ephemerocybe angulata TaxID=980116 RepID=A0A8H6HNG0_9AGAR|nr:hypothetical protein DFP72DRAFT_912891 [Tulosesus angulatus]